MAEQKAPRILHREAGCELNYCRSCSTDFGSVRAFDRHRVGVHDYTYSEGLNMSPPRENGRRCLNRREIQTLTGDAYAALTANTPPKRHGSALLFAQNSHGAWTLREDLEKARAFNA